MADKQEDLSLPLAVISRIINEAIPPNTIVSTEARKVLCKTASVFILYTTATAGSIVAKNNRKTMMANDVLEAMQEMEFNQFLEPLKRSLQHYRDLQQKRKEISASRKSEDSKKPSTSSSSRSPPQTKKKSPPSKKQQVGSNSPEPDVVILSSDSES